MKNKFLSVIVIFVLLVSALALIPPVPARAASFVVNAPFDDALAHDANPGDGICADSGGLCTLRAAVEEADAYPGADIITFHSAMTITLSAASGILPIHEQVLISAASVWDMALDRPGVTIDGGDQSFNCFGVYGGFSEIHGLYVHNCYVGMAVYSSHNYIGGIYLGQPNVISGNASAGIYLGNSDAHDNHVWGNWIGLTPAGDSSQPNAIGIQISNSANDNEIGGTSAAHGNFISGNTNEGIYIDSSNGTKLGSNTIGLSAIGSQPAPNGGDGIRLDGASLTNIGASPLAPNTIAQNGANGIQVSGLGDNDIFNNTIYENQGDGVKIDTYGCDGNALLFNSIHHNGGLGINLEGGANGGIAAPNIVSATTGGVAGTACSNCLVYIFSDSEDEGETLHGNAQADASGNWSFSGVLTGPNITATAFDSNNNTSEFSSPYNLSNQAPNAPANPSPANGATGVSLTPTLRWSGGDPDGDTVTYMVYMADDPSALLSLVWTGTATSHTLNQPLLPNHTYYWQVNATDGAETTAGTTWSFTTGNGSTGYQIFLSLVRK